MDSIRRSLDCSLILLAEENQFWIQLGETPDTDGPVVDDEWQLRKTRPIGQNSRSYHLNLCFPLLFSAASSTRSLNQILRRRPPFANSNTVDERTSSTQY